MSKDLTKLHFQMLRKTAESGVTMDEALVDLKNKLVEDSVQPGEPILIYYDDASGNTGAHLAIPTSGVTVGDEEGYMFPNRREVFERMEEDEEVTTAALIDLDERINTTSGDVQTLKQRIDGLDFSDLDDIVLTKDVTALVNVGAIKTDTTVSAGTSFTAFVEQLLLEEKDWTAHPATISLSASAAGAVDSKLEVGSNLVLTLGNTKHDAYFSSDFGSNTNAGVTWDTAEYHVKSGATTYNTTSSPYTVSAITEGNYEVTVSADYTGKTAASVGLTKNNGQATSVAVSNGTATSSKTTFKAHYKAFLGGTSATTASEFNLATSDILKSGFLPQTSGSIDLVSSTWESDGKNIFVLTTGTLSKALDALSGTELKQDFTPAANYTYTHNGVSTTYHLYLYKVDGGAKMQFRLITVTR